MRYLCRMISASRLLPAVLLCMALAACAEGAGPRQAAAEQPLLVFAAASLQGSMDEAAAAYEATGTARVRVSYAASSALARQIEQGAPADVFVSADGDWMDWLAERELIDAASRRELLGNKLVLIAPTDAGHAQVDLEDGRDLLARLGDGRMALAMTGSVPAGKYARHAFTSLGMWDELAGRTAETDNVRAALMLVARGEAPLGVVYASDARAEPGVQVLASFPAASHPPIVYPVATVAAGAHPTAGEFVDWLGSADAGKIFVRHGFRPI